MVKQNMLPSFSVVVEWENARLSELARTRQMLAQLAIQIGAIEPQLSEPPELIFLYEESAINPSFVESLVTGAFREAPAIAIRIVPTEGSNYYLQKNRGAEIAKRDVIIFVDSDVVPEPGWLITILHYFTNPNIDVVGGNTYIQPTSTYTKAFAAFWFFPLRSSSNELAPSNHFFANNVAFRRSVFLKYRFRDLPLIRGQCGDLAERLLRDQCRIFISNGAHVSHPAPNGLTHFVRRALCQGHDNLTYARLCGDPSSFGPLRRYRESMKESLRQTWSRRQELGLAPAEIAAGLSIAWGYHTIALIGEGVTLLWPRFIRHKLAV